MPPWDINKILRDYEYLQRIIVRLPEDAFVYMRYARPEQIRSERKRLTEELKRDASFKILARFEATLKHEFIQAIDNGSRNRHVDKAYRNLYAARFNQIGGAAKRASIIKNTAPEEILKEVRASFLSLNPKCAERCSYLKGLFSGFRNWYAHGRYSIGYLATPEPRELVEHIGNLKTDINTP
jgi:hypothetical protein